MSDPLLSQSPLKQGWRPVLYSQELSPDALKPQQTEFKTASR
jgi:hypothetical protein